MITEFTVCAVLVLQRECNQTVSSIANEVTMNDPLFPRVTQSGARDTHDCAGPARNRCPSHCSEPSSLPISAVCPPLMNRVRHPVAIFSKDTRQNLLGVFVKKQ